MRISINLASEPFRRDRAVLAASGAVGVMLVALLGVMLYLAYGESARIAEISAAKAKLDQQDRQLQREEATLTGELRRNTNEAVLERSVFLNELIRRKGISWTRMFGDLEGVLPPDVRIISIRPQINVDNQIALDMVVGAQKGEPVVLFLTKLEASPLFGSVQLINTQPPSSTEPLYRYRISVNYAQKL